MRDKRQIIPIVGLLATIAAAVYMVVRLDAQERTALADFTAAATAEVRDAQGQVILRGAFAPVQEEDDDLERKAILAPTGIDADAAGEAEVEFSKANPQQQEIEFSARNLAAGAEVTFAIDGIEVATRTTDSRGRVELEMDVQRPAATPR